MNDYRSLAEFRYLIRRFLHFSEKAAHAVGLESRQYQLMLAIKGLSADQRPRIGDLAEQMQIQHHSAVELANRLADAGYVRRERGDRDRREVLLSLTPKGEKMLRELALHHRAELSAAGPALLRSLKGVMRGTGKSAMPARTANGRK